VAQIIGDEALQTLQNQKQANILQGEIVAFLEDTTSPEYFRAEFSKLGVEITSEWVETMKIVLINQPPDSTLLRLENHTAVLRFLRTEIGLDRDAFNDWAAAQGLSGELLENARSRFNQNTVSTHILVEFDYAVLPQDLTQIMRGFRSVAYQIMSKPVRQVNLKTEPGNEEAVMKRVEPLPFVKNTAFIGVIGE
jgi:hypothetical protein